MGRQKIKYQTTGVPVEQTADEIGTIVARHKVASFAKDYDEHGDLSAVRFVMRHEGQYLPIVLKPRIDKIADILCENSWKSRADVWEQAERIAWRHLKGMMEHLLEAARIGLKSLPHIFMADVEVPDADAEHGYTTLGELFERRHTDVLAAVIQRTDRMLPPAS